jgi:hypothetical protein
LSAGPPSGILQGGTRLLWGSEFRSLNELISILLNKLKIVENTTKNEKKCLWLKLWGPTTQLDTN